MTTTRTRLTTSTLLLVLLLAACGGGSTLPPVTGGGAATWQPPATPAGWALRYGRNEPRLLPAAPGGVFHLDLPQAGAGEVDYVMTGAPAPLTGKSLTVTVEVTGSGVAVPSADDPGCATPPRARLIIQRAGDDLSAKGAYEHYRWWSVPASVPTGSLPLTPGRHTVTVPLDGPDGRGSFFWKSVYAGTQLTNPGEFAAAKVQVGAVGFTLGGCSAGHGASASGGPVRLTLVEYRVDR